jgi:hypothetical protein
MSFNPLRIVSDGTIHGTKVFTPHGVEIPTKTVRFTHNAGEPPMVTLELQGVEFEATEAPGASVASDHPYDRPFPPLGANAAALAKAE